MTLPAGFGRYTQLSSLRNPFQSQSRSLPFLTSSSPARRSPTLDDNVRAPFKATPTLSKEERNHAPNWLNHIIRTTSLASLLRNKKAHCALHLSWVCWYCWMERNWALLCDGGRGREYGTVPRSQVAESSPKSSLADESSIYLPGCVNLLDGPTFLRVGPCLGAAGKRQ